MLWCLESVSRSLVSSDWETTPLFKGLQVGLPSDVATRHTAFGPHLGCGEKDPNDVGDPASSPHTQLVTQSAR